MEINQNVIKSYFKQLGLFDELKLELSERAKPQYIKSKWSNITISTVSYGYGMSITPMHFVQAMIPIVNGGKFINTTVLKDKNNTMFDRMKSISEAPKDRNIFSFDTSQSMNKLLRLTATDGTGRKANVEGLMVGGKTGTAEKLKGKRYDKKSRVSSFIAIAPADKPKYLIYFLLDEPKGNKNTFGFATAGYSAAPSVSRILSRITAIMGDKPKTKEEEDAMKIEYKLH